VPEGDGGTETYAFCPGCGAEASPGASFCAECGLSLLRQSVQMDASRRLEPHRHGEEAPHGLTVEDGPQQRNEPALSASDEDVLVNLRGYKQHVNIKCLLCGYQGLMGVIRVQRPWWSKPWLIVAFVFSGVGILLLILLVLTGNQATVYEVQCPSCKRHLVYPAGAKLRG
jgi:zinc-ribbon domain